MCEILDYSIEHKDIYCNKYSESSDDMDLYITDSLQDMLDMDIKTEMATDLGSVTDFSDSLGLSFSEMPPLLDMDADNSAMWLTNSSSFGNNLDLYDSEANAIMVNPNSVMPSTFAETIVKTIKEESSNIMLTSAASTKNGLPAPSPKEEKSHLTFSPSTLKVPTIKQEQTERRITKKTIEESPMVIYVRKDAAVKDLLTEFESKKNKAAISSAAIRVKPQSELLKLTNKNCSILNSNQKLQQVGSKTIISGNIHILDPQQSRAIIANGNKNGATILINNPVHSTSGRQIIKTAASNYSQKFLNVKNVTNSGYPKPAYSYSCLIAMALKNSRTGSLPVSEIYNFMCQHFPYFKTAPNGWKNSVRHNLSLNKCFEKIEKPSTNGSQRKACLWAMNPTKVEKMDEEVQKWSRKDPEAIKNAMVYPDNLEALERGEMKYSYTGAVADDVDDDDVDVDVDQDDAKDEDDDVMEPEGASESELEEVTGGVIVNDELGSDVEVLHTFEDEDLDMSQSVKLDLSFTEDEYLSVCPPKRQKTTFIYQPIASTAHTNRRKTPLVNRVL